MYNLYKLFQFSGDAMQILLHKLQICSHVTGSTELSKSLHTSISNTGRLLKKNVLPLFWWALFQQNMQYLQVKQTDVVYFLKSSFLTVPNCFSSLGSYTRHHTSNELILSLSPKLNRIFSTLEMIGPQRNNIFLSKSSQRTIKCRISHSR